MDLTVALEIRYFVTPDGQGWSAAGMAQHFWERYLDVFDRVRIVARAVHVEHANPIWTSVTNDRIILHPMPNYQGPWQYVRRSWAFRQAIRSAAPKNGAVILRAPSQVANCLERYLSAWGWPYALEVVGDPYDVCSPGVLDHPLRPLLRWWFPRQLRRQCEKACGVAYVTREYLQRRYPAGQMETGVSDIELLPEHATVKGSSQTASYSGVELEYPGAVVFNIPAHQHSYTLVMVGSLEQMYKGPDVLIKAAARCVHHGLDVKVVIVGDGRYRESLETLSETLGMASRVKFTGLVPAGEPVRRILVSSDLFVLPSRTEGLPRALIEAMALGLPCIASGVGGIPELLENSSLVAPGDSDALAAKIAEVLTQPSRRLDMSRRNRTVAMEHCEAVLRPKRLKFYRYVRDYTEKWQTGRLAHDASSSRR
jgi:glycosyltransferase involved in cell wall biosynthesis